MKKKALVLAVCMAFAVPTISSAKTLPSDLLGISLGEIQSNSSLHEPFQAIIPILFTGAEQSNQLRVRLAPDSVFKQIGAERLPVHNSLNFQISVQNNKPIILVKSIQPIQIPFLNFVLEVQSPEGSIYQDYTALLDPADNKIVTPVSVKLPEADEFFTQAKALLESKEIRQTQIPEQEIKKLKSDLLLSAYSSPRLKTGQPTKYVVKAGDSLSQIAQTISTGEVYLDKMIKAIHLNNPNAFANNDINKLSRGAILRIPTVKEINSSNFVVATKQEEKESRTNVNKTVITSHIQNTKNTYKVKSGDTLFKIAKEISNKSLSLTKTMKILHSNNPHAFSRNNINRLIAGATLSIPSANKTVVATKEESIRSKPPMEKITDSAPATPARSIASAEKNELPQNVTSDTKEEVQRGSYVAKKGDTLAQITKELGYENISFTKMMKAIFSANPDAFMKNNITQLKEGAIVAIPTADEVNSTQKNTIQPSSLAGKNNKLAINNLEKRLRELRRKLSISNSKVFNLELALKDKVESIEEQLNIPKSSDQINNDINAFTLAAKTPVENTGIEKERERVATKDLPKESEWKTVEHPQPILENANALVSKETVIIKEEPTQTALLKESDWKVVKRSQYIPDDVSTLIENSLISHFESMSNKDLAYSAMALFLGLMLIGYRKQLYEYVSISYDGPKYYSSEDTKKVHLSEAETSALEKDILNFHQTLVNNEVENPDAKENIEINQDFLNECETLAEDLYRNTDTAETTCDDYSNSNIDKLKTEMTYESSVLDEIINRHVNKESKDENDDVSTEIIESELLENNEGKSKSSLQFEEISLDLFEESGESVLEIQEPEEIDTSEDVLSEDNITEEESIVPFFPETDWEKVLYNADLELARSELELKEEEGEKGAESDPHETKTECITEPEPIIETEESTPEQKLTQPFNFSSSSFETLEMPEIDTIKTDFTPLKTNADKFNEAVEDEFWNYEEYCRNEPILDIEKELETA